jgi:hypothetical protein
MAIATYHIMICDCDMVGIPDLCGVEVSGGDTITETRKLAKDQGWKSIKTENGTIDLCPSHAEQHEKVANAG